MALVFQKVPYLRPQLVSRQAPVMGYQPVSESGVMLQMPCFWTPNLPESGRASGQLWGVRCWCLWSWLVSRWVPAPCQAAPREPTVLVHGEGTMDACEGMLQPLGQEVGRGSQQGTARFWA